VALVLLRVENGRVSRVGAYSKECGLDAGGLRVLWLTGVPARDSLAVLEPVVGAEAHSLAEEALAAVAAHADAGADAVLERQTVPGRPAKLREQAAFWMGEARGRRGYETLRRLVRDDADRKFREHLTFALSQSDVPEATLTLVETARQDKDRDVRGQALFWLAQKAGRQAAQAITQAIENDPDTEVKKKAVFALSEMDGVPLLIQVARTNRNPAVREQAFFWLGQSEDPKALDFLAEVLRR
jgi:HEAT repeat protein